MHWFVQQQNIFDEIFIFFKEKQIIDKKKKKLK